MPSCPSTFAFKDTALLMAVNMFMLVLWVVMLCELVDSYQYFIGTYRYLCTNLHSITTNRFNSDSSSCVAKYPDMSFRFNLC
jgi:hypothetical protein